MISLPRMIVPTGHPVTVMPKAAAPMQPRVELERMQAPRGPLTSAEEKGVAVEWLEAEGPLVEHWPPESYLRLFGNLPSEPWTEASGLREPPVPMITQITQPTSRERIEMSCDFRTG